MSEDEWTSESSEPTREDSNLGQAWHENVEQLARLACASEDLGEIGDAIGRVARSMRTLAGGNEELKDCAQPLCEPIVALQRGFELLSAEVMEFSLRYEDAITTDDATI